MASINIVAPTEGDVTRIGPITTRIVEDGSHTAGHMGAAVVNVAPRSPGPPQHVHRKHDEGFLVISGTMRFTVEGTFHDVAAGSYIAVPRDVPHSFSNPFEEPASMFCIMTPDLYVPYFKDLKVLQDGVGLHPPAILKIMERYATEPA